MNITGAVMVAAAIVGAFAALKHDYFFACGCAAIVITVAYLKVYEVVS